jgi:DNA-directed RNA polymerase subunit RPC12/RpoP
MDYVDGNALGGIFLELFGIELTVANGVCGACGRAGEMATLHVYLRAPGAVVRCPQCSSVLMKIVRSDDRTWLDLSGLRTLEIED